MPEIVAMASNVVVAFCAMFAAWQYFDGQSDRKVQRTLEIVAEFDSEKYNKAKREIDRIANLAIDNISANSSEIASLPESQQLEVRGRLMVTAAYNRGKSGEIPDAILDVVSYFNGVQSCLEIRACDKKVAHSLLDEYASGFWRTYLPVIQSERMRRRPHFGAGLERFIDQSRA